jgi:hypothetical protein
MWRALSRRIYARVVESLQKDTASRTNDCLSSMLQRRHAEPQNF